MNGKCLLDVKNSTHSSKIISGISGVILAGGGARRMGTNKAFLKIGQQMLIERVFDTMAALFKDIIIVTNNPEPYSFFTCRKVADIYSGVGSIAGLHSGLSASSTELIFAVACDMPFLNPALIRLLCHEIDDYDAVVPINSFGLREPLHAIYSKSALNILRQTIENGDKSILLLLDKLRTKYVPSDQIRSITGAEESFMNVNTLEEFAKATKRLKSAQHVCGNATL